MLIFDMCKQWHSSLILKSVIKPMDLPYFAFQFYLNLRLAAFVNHFFKFNANLVMFTTINIYETILDKYYVHHILKSCIYTGMIATTKFVLCHTRQHLNLPVVTSSLFTFCVTSEKVCLKTAVSYFPNESCFYHVSV